MKELKSLEDLGVEVRHNSEATHAYAATITTVCGKVVWTVKPPEESSARARLTDALLEAVVTCLCPSTFLQRCAALRGTRSPMVHLGLCTLFANLAQWWHRGSQAQPAKPFHLSHPQLRFTAVAIFCLNPKLHAARTADGALS